MMLLAEGRGLEERQLYAITQAGYPHGKLKGKCPNPPLSKGINSESSQTLGRRTVPFTMVNYPLIPPEDQSALVPLSIFSGT